MKARPKNCLPTTAAGKNQKQMVHARNHRRQVTLCFGNKNTAIIVGIILVLYLGSNKLGSLIEIQLSSEVGFFIAEE